MAYTRSSFTMASVCSRKYYGLFSLFFVTLFIASLAIFLSVRCVGISKLRNPYILHNLPYQSWHVYEELSSSDHQFLLSETSLTFTVHYMWCRKSYFEYKHYLSILSVVKGLQPDQIVFHYLEMPLVDRKGYFTWFEDIQAEVAMLVLKPISNHKYCGHDFSRGVRKDQDFPNPNGIFMTDDIAVTNLTRGIFLHLMRDAERQKPVCNSASDETCGSFSQLFLIPQTEPYSIAQGKGHVVLVCPTILSFNKESQQHCVQISQRLFPSDIWTKNTSFDAFARRIAYNSKTALIPTPNVQTALPRIAHVLKFDGQPFLDPLCYLSLKSAFVLGGLQYVFVHASEQLTGHLWERLKSEHSAHFVYGPELHESSSFHEQLLYGLYSLLQHGGLLMTCDIVIQKQVSHFFDMPAVSSVKKSIYRIIHHHVDFSVLFAQQGSAYLKSLLPILKELLEIRSDRHLGAVSYHVYEQFPSFVLMEDNLIGHQSCSGSQCVPAPGEADVRQAYSSKLSWSATSSKPVILEDLKTLNTPLKSKFQQILGTSIE